jgi:hypothetical protein
MPAAEDTAMMQRFSRYAALTVACFLAAVSPAVAAGRTVWVGRDVDNTSVIWSCSNVGGNDWKLKKNGRTIGDYEGVTSTAEFVELRLKGTTGYDRVRLYGDNLSMNKEGSRTEWIQMARGKWAD